MIETLFRAKVYQTFQLGSKPKVRVAIAFGPWVPSERRAQILVNALNRSEPQYETWLQKAER